MVISKSNKKSNTKKVAITIPEDLLDAIDELSGQQGTSRSRLISDLLRDKVVETQNERLRSAYDKVFSDKAARQEQLMANATAEE